MKKAALVLCLLFCLFAQNLGLCEKNSISLSTGFLRKFSQNDLQELYSFILDSIQNNDFSNEVHEHPNSSDISYSFYNTNIEGVSYQYIFASSNITQHNDYISSMVMESNLPFGDQIHSSKIYADTVNEYISLFGNPEYTFNDETNKLMKRNNSISWYIEEYDVTLTILYLDGDIAKARFPVIETSLYQGDLRIK